MQDSSLSILKKTSVTKYLVAGLKVGLLLGMLYFVGVKFWEHQDSLQGMLAQLNGGWGEYPESLGCSGAGPGSAQLVAGGCKVAGAGT